MLDAPVKKRSDPAAPKKMNYKNYLRIYFWCNNLQPKLHINLHYQSVCIFQPELIAWSVLPMLLLPLLLSLSLLAIAWVLALQLFPVMLLILFFTLGNRKFLLQILWYLVCRFYSSCCYTIPVVAQVASFVFHSAFSFSFSNFVFCFVQSFLIRTNTMLKK